MSELTDLPFAVNHAVCPFNEEVFALTLEAKPKVVSLGLGDIFQGLSESRRSRRFQDKMPIALSQLPLRSFHCYHEHRASLGKGALARCHYSWTTTGAWKA